MSGQHTPGRLRYEHGLLLSEGSPDEMAQIPFYRDGVHDHDARRLVACWNACDGIETYALELMVGDLSIKAQITSTHKPAAKPTSRAVEYRRQRDALLAAAQSTLANNLHLADGDNCTLIDLKRAVERITVAA